MWLGRADAGEDAMQWDDMVLDGRAQDDADGLEASAVYIGGKKEVTNYLRQGMWKLAEAGMPLP